VRHRGHVYEVDVFEGALAGLIVAELETEAEVADADLPGWLGREVTGEAPFYNSSLAMHGLPALIA
jgi:CYTH domain-containing protein